jgi:hypothetical protein
VKIKPKGKNATSPPKTTLNKSTGLRRWPAIGQFLAMADSTVHRWAKEGMPARCAGRNTAASLEELNRWLQRTSARPRALTEITREKCFDRKLWLKFNFFALVEPDENILPARTVCNGVTQNIGINHLSSAEPI